ncbi:hypothetical protein PRZ48_014180 [Zasmidium cellare]|uniref:Uncharacterized protein n=1 Tax=Zasmidium cellare TaxID=395010 RepID=A0ABR0E093_ZASCE|nr:hypothetical protein PRZ48_014180 [Zasmidium cellare]
MATTSLRLAWIGLGNMGSAMCRNIVKKANPSTPVTIYDILPERVEKLHSELGSTSTAIASSIPQAAEQADAVFYSLPNDEIVPDVLAQILGSLAKNQLVVDFSTVSPETTTHEADLVQAQGSHFVACPVFGTAPNAEAGQLVCVPAGPAVAVAQLRPFCEGVIARKIIDLSDSAPSKATTLKILGNGFLLSTVHALAEAHVVAEKASLDPTDLHKFFELMLGGVGASYSARFLHGDWYRREPPIFSVDLARKDARHAQNLARNCGGVVKSVDLPDVYLRVVQERKGSSGELAAIYGAKRLEAGLPYEN